MTIKNYGPATSGFLDPENRNWETTVFQSGKPVLDKELNLQQSILEGFSQGALRRAMPSGWIADDFLHTSNSISSIFTPIATANTIEIPQGLLAHVNGWLLKVAHTGTSGSNQLTIPAAPTGVGTKRTDLVILEVWRRLLSTDSTGKSVSGRIWQNGNVKTSPADDLTLNYVDDILDVNVGQESTKRVQIQYRLRVISGVDVFSYPYGLDDPTVVAHSVPTGPGVPDGLATAFAYSNQLANGDAGLWRAGDGDPANALETVDGYMYAIPLMAIFRRNTSAFARNTNQNGGVASGGASDRPDGLFYDIVNARDVADLRLGVSPSGWDYREILDKNVNFLFDNALKTEWVQTPNGAGMHGHTVLWADEIGVTNAHGGDGTTTGDTPAGAFIGEFDAVRRTFSDRAVYEVLTVKIEEPDGGWANASLDINFTSIVIHPYSAFNYASYAPNVICTDLIGAHFIGATSGKKTFDALSNITQVTGLGEAPLAALTVELDALTGKGVTDEDLYIDLLVCYPPGAGLTHTPTATYGDESFSINNPAALPATLPVGFSELANTAIDPAHREVQLQYETVELTFSFAADSVESAHDTFFMPERVNTIVSVLKNGNPIAGSTTIGSDGRTITLTNGADATDPGDTLEVTYTALRPLPQNNEQLTIWYEARAPQTARDSLLGTSLTLIPKYIPDHLYTITTGSGSEDEGYPFPYAYVQTGGVYPSSGGSFAGEHELSARGATSVADFSASTGFLKLATFVPFVPSPEALTLTRSSPGDVDNENRTFFKSVPEGAYLPNAYAQDLSDPAKHKVVFPFLAELAATSSLGIKGQLVLVLLTRWAAFDPTNAVYFDADLAQSSTTASVFRLKGNLLNRGA